MPLPEIFFLFFLLSLSFQSAISAGADARTAYDVIQYYRFPIGILPKGALGYELDQTTGEFKIFFNGSCGFSLEGSYSLEYNSTISGYISENKLTGLTGVSVKILFLWLDIVEVVRNRENLEFSVGIASASFPIGNFNECPQCGCGLDCNNLQVASLRTNPLALSF